MCCLFGFLDYGNKFNTKQKNKIISILSRECEERGTDATGISFNARDGLHIHKKPLPAHKAKLYIPENVKVVMGHTRFTTQGSEKHNYNNHPFRGTTCNGQFALAHNGVLRNDDMLKLVHKLPETNIETDSYVAVQLIEKKQQLSFDSLKFMAESVSGSFCFTVLDEKDNLYLIKGDNPMTIYDFPALGMVIYASTKTILDKAIKKMRIHKFTHNEIKISGGDILKISADGITERSKFEYDDWFYNFTYSSRPYTQPKRDDSYVALLKNSAGYFGMTEADIDFYLDNGLEPEDIEDIMYSCEYATGYF